MATRRATKIVATLGPASSDPQLLEAMIRAGVNVVRLNFSHGRRKTISIALPRCALPPSVPGASGHHGRPAGPQDPRVGKFADGKVFLEPGAKFVLDASRHRARRHQRRGPGLQGAARDVKAGDLLLLNDGLIVLTVDAVRGESAHHRQAGR